MIIAIPKNTPNKEMIVKSLIYLLVKQKENIDLINKVTFYDMFEWYTKLSKTFTNNYIESTVLHTYTGWKINRIDNIVLKILSILSNEKLLELNNNELIKNKWYKYINIFREISCKDLPFKWIDILFKDYNPIKSAWVVPDISTQYEIDYINKLDNAILLDYNIHNVYDVFNIIKYDYNDILKELTYGKTKTK